MTVQGIRIIPVLAVLMTCTSPCALATEYGDWKSSTTNTVSEAFTGNDSGSVFGFICINNEACGFYLNTGTACEEDAEYPVLINGLGGSLYMPTNCTVLEDDNGKVRHFLMIDDEAGLLTKTVQDSGQIGFAIPLTSGRFAVSRFSLRGSTAAMKRVLLEQEALAKKGDKKSGTRVRDETL